MVDMPKCRDCRWWVAGPPYVSTVIGIEMRGPATEGVCSRIETIANEDDMAWICSDKAELVTRPDFGCVQFEAKPFAGGDS